MIVIDENFKDLIDAYSNWKLLLGLLKGGYKLTFSYSEGIYRINYGAGEWYAYRDEDLGGTLTHIIGEEVGV